MSQQKKTKEDIQKILNHIKYPERHFVLMEKGDGFLLQMVYMEADISDTKGKETVQKTRKWYISPYSTETEIVETAFACVCRSMMHVVGEHFTYYGKLVYSPHFSIAARMEIIDNDDLDGRVPLNK
jgi:hypothetical protein